MFLSAAQVFVKLMIVGMNMPIHNSSETHVFGPISPGFPFDRAAVSWNVEGVQRCRFEIDARVDGGEWQEVGAWPPKGPSHDLTCRHAGNLFLRVIASAKAPATIRMMTVAFERGEGGGQGARAEASEAPGLRRPDYVEVGGTRETQQLAAYLFYWGYTLGRSDLRVAPQSLFPLVPERCATEDLARAAGSFLGIRSYVTFFHSLDDLVAWTQLAPVICALPEPTLVEGLTKDGTVALLAPFEGGLRRVTMERGRFDRTWARQGRKVLIVQPKGLDTPAQNPDSPSWIHLHFEPSTPVEKEGGYWLKDQVRTEGMLTASALPVNPK